MEVPVYVSTIFIFLFFYSLTMTMTMTTPPTLPGCDLACIVAPPRDGVRLPVINYNMHKVGLIAR